MKKIILCLIFVFAMGVSARAEEYIHFKELSDGKYISKQAVEIDGKLTAQGFYGVTDKNGNVIVPFKYDNIYELKGIKQYAVRKPESVLYGVYDEQKGQITACKYNNIYVADGKCYVKVYGDIIKCYLLEDGKETLTREDIRRYENEPSENEVRKALIESVTTHNSLTGKIAKGDIPPDYGYIKEMRGGEQYVVRKISGSLFGIIDGHNNQIVDFKYNRIFEAGENVYGVIGSDYYKIKGKKEIYLNTIEGRVDVNQNGELVYWLEKDGIKRYGLVDEQLKVVAKPSYDEGINFNENNLAIVHNADLNGYGVIDKKGRTIVKPRYSEIYFDRNGFGIVCRADTNKYGIVDIKGRTIVEPQYSTIQESVVGGVYRLTKENGAEKDIDLLKWGKPLVLYHISIRLLLLCLAVVGVALAVLKIRKRAATN